MNISVVGAGYVGLTWAAVLADLGHKVWVVRKDKEKNEALKNGKIHFFEPGLEELVKNSLKNSQLFPTTDYSEAIPNSELIFICVGTPSLSSGSIDLSQVFTAAEEVGKSLKKGFTLVVSKSTIPPGTTKQVKKIIEKNKNDKANFEVAFCPEFLREGSAVADTRRPDRVIIGSETVKASEILQKFHKDFKAPIFITKIASAELIKYASNNYLALRIVLANQIADLCEESEADINEVIEGMGMDKRIGSHYWYPGLGYGGSCFPKDVAALAAYARQAGIKGSLFEKIDELNAQRIGKILQKVKKNIGGFSKKTIGVLGLACKRGTDDVRKSPAIKVVELLQKDKVRIKAYDPLAMKNAAKVLTGVDFCQDAYQVAEKADALFILNDTEAYVQLDYKKIKKLMREKFIFDSRNLLNKREVEKLGFKYQGIGK